MPVLAAPLSEQRALPGAAGQWGEPILTGPAQSYRQFALSFPHESHYREADFLPAPSNAEALAWLADMAQWPQRRLALWGSEGCGKTHLVQVWAERHGATRLAGPGLTWRPPERPLAVDDADTTPEQPLLHLLNAAAEAGWPVLLAARDAPSRWPATLPDLVSRLRATTAVRIGPAEDELLRELLRRLLAERQLAVPAPVQDWLLLRLPRSQAAIREAAARLDRAALAAGGAVTRAVAAQVLGGLDPDMTARLQSDEVFGHRGPATSPEGDRLL